MALGDITFVRKTFSFDKSSDDGDGTPPIAFTPALNILLASFDILSTTVEFNKQTKEGVTEGTVVFILQDKTA